jgi:hypothetical protein
VHFILIKPALSDHLSYVTLFQCSLGRSHKTGLTRFNKKKKKKNTDCQDITEILLNVALNTITLTHSFFCILRFMSTV